MLTGPAAEADTYVERPVVHVRRGGAQAHLLVRSTAHDPVPPGWDAHPVGLEELALAYLREPGAARQRRQRPYVVWFTGISGAGKSTIANLVETELQQLGYCTYLLDGDNVRHGLNKDLGFTDADRVENIRRIGEVAKLMVDAGLIVLVSFISPFRSERRMARDLLDESEFVEVYVNTPLVVAEERIQRASTRQARRGELKNFTGVDSPYEPPEHPELEILTTSCTPDAAATKVIQRLRNLGLLNGSH